MWMDNGRRTDGRTMEPAYTISSPGAFGSGELKRNPYKLYVILYYFLEKRQRRLLKKSLLSGLLGSKHGKYIKWCIQNLTDQVYLIYHICSVK